MSGGTTAALVIAAAVSATAAISQANAQKASEDYQAQVAKGNAEAATNNANMAMASGEEQAAVQEQKTRAQVGEIQAAQASSGVDINSLTSSDVRTSQGELGALDAQTIRSNAARQAYGYETQSANFSNQSSADTASGNNAETSGDFSAASSILSSASSTSASNAYSKIMGNSTGINTGTADASGSNAIGSGGVSGNDGYYNG